MRADLSSAVRAVVHNIRRLARSFDASWLASQEAWLFGIALSALAIVSAAVSADIADDLMKRCSNQAYYPADDRIAACSMLLRHRYLSDRERAEVYYDRGTAYYNKSQWDASIADYTKAIALRPDYEFAFVNRGIAYSHKRYYRRAITDYDRAIALVPLDDRAYENKANLREKMGKCDLAIKDYDHAIILNAENARTHINRATCYIQLKDYNRAKLDYAKAMDLEPRNSDALDGLCYILVEQHKAAEALQYCDRALVAAPGNPEIWDTRGFAKLWLCRYRAAIRDYSKALELQPRSASSLYGRGAARLGLGDKGGYADESAALRIDPNVARKAHFPPEPTRN